MAARKYSVTINGHRTSITLEEEFWQALGDIARARGQTAQQIITAIDANRPDNLSGALRVFVLDYYRKKD